MQVYTSVVYWAYCTLVLMVLCLKYRTHIPDVFDNFVSLCNVGKSTTERARTQLWHNGNRQVSQHAAVSSGVSRGKMATTAPIDNPCWNTQDGE